MIILTKFLTVALLLCSLAFGSEETEERQCHNENVVIGETGRKFWADGLDDGFRSEFVDQIQKKEDLFDKLVPEFEFDIGLRGKGKVTFTREVRDHLPRPANGLIRSNDFFNLMIKNELFLELSAGVSGPYLYSSGNTGLSLKHVTKHFPGKKSSLCDFYTAFMDKEDERAQELMDGFERSCTSRDKWWITEAYEDVVDIVSDALGWGLGFIVDSEKNVKFTEKLLDPLKVHTKLGVPIDYKVFFENHRDLNIGDIIEHTTFIGLTPGGAKLDFIDLFTPTHSYYGRTFRTVSMKKLYKNKVLIEFEDTVLYGNNTEIYKIKPKFFDLIKVNFGRWGIKDFKQETLLQRFEVDLNKSSGTKFFRKVLGSLYLDDLAYDLFTDQMIDASPYMDAVVADAPVFRDSEGEENVLQFKFPGMLDYKNASYKKVSNIEYKDREYTRGDVLHQSKLKFKFPIQYGFFKKWKADRDYTCFMHLASDISVAFEDDSALNIECKYFNRYASNKHFEDVKEYLNIFMEGKVPEDVEEILKNVDYEQKDKLNLHTKLSFSKTEIARILAATNDDIYNVISKLLFGAKAKNVFAEKYHKQWRRARIRSLRKRGHKKLSSLNSCSLLFERLKITKHRERYYDEFAGLVGKGKGLRAFSRWRCYSYFLIAKDMVKAISKLQETARSKKRLNKFLDIFEDLERADFVQAVLTALAGGLRPDGVRYTYFLSSPYIGDTVVRDNGTLYKVEDPRLQKSLTTEMRPVLDPRMRNVKFKFNQCQPDVIMAYVDMKYLPKNREDIYAKFTVTDFSLIKDNYIKEVYLNFSTQATRLNREDEPDKPSNTFAFRIQLDEPIDETSAHNIYVELMNENNFRLSRELKIYTKEYNDVLADIKKKLKEARERLKENSQDVLESAL